MQTRILALLCLSSCGSPNNASPPDAAGADAAPFMPALHGPRLQVPNQGGPVVAHPELVTVTWTGDPLATTVAEFDAWMATSAYFKDAMSEYGIVPGTDGGAHVLSPAPAAQITDADLRKILGDAIAAGSLPPRTADRIYVAYLPPNVTIEQVPGALSCSAFVGYHSAFDSAAGKVVYAVVPRCPSLGGAIGDAQLLSWNATHEIVEAATDPIKDALAWVSTDFDDRRAALGSELADLCPGPVMHEGRVVTGIHSNRAAAAGKRVCVPAAAGFDFGADPSPTNLMLAAGATGTVSFTVYTTGRMGAIHVFSYAGAGMSSIKLSKDTANNGDVVTATVTLAQNLAPGMRLVLQLLLYSEPTNPFEYQTSENTFITVK